MKTVYARCLALGLLLITAACGDPPQFNETLIRQSENLEPEPEMTPAPGQGPDTNTTSPGYEGEEQDTPPPPVPPVVIEETDEAEDPSQSESTAPAPRLFADCEESPEMKIVAQLYQLPESTSQLPEFSQMSSLRSVCLGQLNTKDRQFSEGFPGVEGLFEWFALDMNFYVTVPKTGVYDFTLAADDGAILWINDSMIIDNDGLHEVQEKQGQVHLEAGVHHFRVAYYQGPRWRIALELFWTIPGSSTRSHIPAVLISRME